MEFKFETIYSKKAVTAMAKAMRKTVRKKRSRRSHIFGWIVVIISLLLSLPLGGEEFVIDSGTVVTWLVTLVLLAVLIFEDKLNGYVARKRMLPGLSKSVTVFTEDGYNSETEVGKSEFKYDNIVQIAETGEYFVLIFSQSHAQVYDKSTIEGGTADDFREFIGGITGKSVVKIK